MMESAGFTSTGFKRSVFRRCRVFCGKYRSAARMNFSAKPLAARACTADKNTELPLPVGVGSADLTGALSS